MPSLNFNKVGNVFNVSFNKKNIVIFAWANCRLGMYVAH